MAHDQGSKHRLVLLCAGLDSVRRGYETHVRRLFEHLKVDLPPNWSVTLFKRDGSKSEGEVVLCVPARSSQLARFLAKFRGDTLYWEQLFFSFTFICRSVLRQEHVDRIYTPEPVTAKVLFRLRRFLPGHPEILFMHGVWMEPADYVPYADRIQEVSVVNFGRSSKYSPSKSISLIPHFDDDTQSRTISTDEFRQKHGLGNQQILLNVGMVGRTHKRTDYLLREAQNLPPDWTVLVCGPVADSTVLEEGKQLLGDRFRHLNLLPEEMSAAYQSANLFVHCALTEGFGIVIIEAMKSGLPMLVHDGELFQWIVGGPEQHVDMATPGRLRERLSGLFQNPDRLKEYGDRNRQAFLARYTWSALRNTYIEFLTK